MVNVKNGRGFPYRRGHQYHIRFQGDRCSTVDAKDVIAALRAGDRMPAVCETTSSYVKLQEPTVSAGDTTDKKGQSNVMIDPFKLAWFKTGLIDPDIIVAECERFGPVKHCRQFHGISFPLFNRRK